MFLGEKSDKYWATENESETMEPLLVEKGGNVKKGEYGEEDGQEGRWVKGGDSGKEGRGKRRGSLRKKEGETVGRRKREKEKV